MCIPNKNKSGLREGELFEKKKIIIGRKLWPQVQEASQKLNREKYLIYVLVIGRSK